MSIYPFLLVILAIIKKFENPLLRFLLSSNLSANINVNQFLPSTITIFIPTTILNWNICQAWVLTLVFCKPRFILEKLLFVHVSLCVHSPIECNGHCLKNGTLKHFLDNICPRSKIWVYRNCPPIGVTQTQTPFYVIKIDFSRISFTQNVILWWFWNVSICHPTPLKWS